MQTTIIASLIHDGMSSKALPILDNYTILYNVSMRKLYAQYISYCRKNNTNKLPDKIVKQFKSNLSKQFGINNRQYTSIYKELFAQINSALSNNKNYIQDTSENIQKLEKSIKSKQNTLDKLIIKLNAKNYKFNRLDNVNLSNLKSKLFYLNDKLNTANKKLVRLKKIEKTGIPHLCFGSKKLFRQQFLINTTNNKTGFTSHNDWYKHYYQERHKSFSFVGSHDETMGNQNCQIKHISQDIYELTLNVDPNAMKHKDKYITVQIQVHNDRNDYLFNAVKNHKNKDKKKSRLDNLTQPITYRFYKDYEKNTYKVCISLDKSMQKPDVISYKFIGSIGIDINHDHLSMAEIKHDGNLLHARDIQLNLKDKTTEESTNNIGLAVKEIIAYAVKVNKPIFIEDLDFTKKKKELQSGFNTKYNEMLSRFAYGKIVEIIKSRAFDSGVEVIDVNPAYTSKIGRFKYQNQYKLTTHQAAAFVIARRGLFSYTKYINKSTDIKNKDKKVIGRNIERKPITIINKEKTISNRRIEYYPFGLPVRNSQKQDGIYWKEIEQNYLKAKKHRIDLKRKKLILGNNSSKLLSREITVVADNSEVNRDLNPNLLFQPF